MIPLEAVPAGSTINVGMTFGQQLIITAISTGFSVGVSIVTFYILFKTDLMFDLMERMGNILGKNHVYKDYACTCSRCKFQLRTKRGLKQWKKDHKWKKDDWV